MHVWNVVKAIMNCDVSNAFMYAFKPLASLMNHLKVLKTYFCGCTKTRDDTVYKMDYIVTVYGHYILSIL